MVIFCNSKHSRCFLVHEVRTAAIGGKKQPPDWSRPPLLDLFIHFYWSRRTSLGLPVYIWYSFYFLFWLDLNGRFCLASASRTVFVIIEALVLLTDVILTRIYVELLRNTLQINVIQTVFLSFQSFLFIGTPFIFQTNWWVYFYENQIKIMWSGLKTEKDLLIMLVIHKILTI